MDEIEQQFVVDTPESVEFRYTLAGVGARFCAALLDHLIIALILTALILLGSIAVTALQIGAGSLAASLLTAILIVVAFLVIVGYYVVIETVQRGQTPGKRAMGLRVIRSNGLPITFSDSLLRNLVRVVDFLPVSYALGVVMMFFNPQWRRLGDIAANTVVVREVRGYRLEQIAVKQQAATPQLIGNTSGLLARTAPLPVRVGLGEGAPQPAYRPTAAETGVLPSGYRYVVGIEQLSAFDYQLVRDYLTRRLTLPYDRQIVLARDLALLVAARIDLTEPIHNYLIFLNQAVESYEQSKLR